MTWTKQSSLHSIYFRDIEPNGTSTLIEAEVSQTDFTSLNAPSIDADFTGNYAIVWDANSQTYIEDDIYIRMYHYTKLALCDEFIVNTATDGAHSNPKVSMKYNGDCIVVWQSDTNSNGKDIFAQRLLYHPFYYGEPNLIGDQFQINTYLPDNQIYPAVALTNNDTFITVWQSDDQDQSGYGIFAQPGPYPASADLDDSGFVQLKDYCIIAYEWLKNENHLLADLIDDNLIDEKDLNEFCQQWLIPRYQCQQVNLDDHNQIDCADFTRLAANWQKQGPNLIGDIDQNGSVEYRPESTRLLLARNLSVIYLFAFFKAFANLLPD